MPAWELWVYGVMGSFWPLPLIAGLAAFVQGWTAGGAVLLVLAMVMVVFGRRMPPPPER